MTDAPHAPTIHGLGGGLHYVEGTVGFYGFDIVTRMSLVELSTGGVLVISPLPLDAALERAIAQLGPVRFVLSPNKIHNQGLESFARSYPSAELWASPGLPERRRDLRFAGVLGDRPEPPWAADLDQLTTAGNVFFSEVVFFHAASRTLIVADLVENLSHDALPGAAGQAAAKLVHIYGRALPSPEFRAYTMDADAARSKLLRMHDWPFETILMAHGDLVTERAHDVFMDVADHLCAEVLHRPAHRRAFYARMARLQ